MEARPILVFTMKTKKTRVMSSQWPQAVASTPRMRGLNSRGQGRGRKSQSLPASPVNLAEPGQHSLTSSWYPWRTSSRQRDTCQSAKGSTWHSRSILQKHRYLKDVDTVEPHQTLRTHITYSNWNLKLLSRTSSCSVNICHFSTEMAEIWSPGTFCKDIWTCKISAIYLLYFQSCESFCGVNSDFH